MSEYEHGLNDLAGGKLLSPPKHFNCRSIKSDIEKLNSLDIDNYNGKWANFVITKTGTFQGINIFDTEAAARSMAVEWLRIVKERRGNLIYSKCFYCSLGTGKRLFNFSDFKTIIQLPIAKT